MPPTTTIASGRCVCAPGTSRMVVSLLRRHFGYTDRDLERWTDVY
ncbi:MAG TPA: hypothetical protein VKA46_20415 [Gemmataceae bacterium]|nr:hypothetical protein [Gemmataceae bacterium]